MYLLSVAPGSLRFQRSSTGGEGMDTLAGSCLNDRTTSRVGKGFMLRNKLVTLCEKVRDFGVV